MYLIDQETAIQIAKLSRIEPAEIRELFEAKTENQAEKLEMKMRKEIEKKTGSYPLARAVVVYSPLLFANEAISLYIQKSGNQWLRRVAPEILTVDETVYLALRDLMSLTDQEEEMLLKELNYLSGKGSKNNSVSTDLDFPDTSPTQKRKAERKVTDERAREEIDNALDEFIKLINDKKKK